MYESAKTIGRRGGVGAGALLELLRMHSSDSGPSGGAASRAGASPRALAVNLDELEDRIVRSCGRNPDGTVPFFEVVRALRQPYVFFLEPTRAALVKQKHVVPPRRLRESLGGPHAGAGLDAGTRGPCTDILHALRETYGAHEEGLPPDPAAGRPPNGQIPRSARAVLLATFVANAEAPAATSQIGLQTVREIVGLHASAGDEEVAEQIVRAADYSSSGRGVVGFAALQEAFFATQRRTDYPPDEPSDRGEQRRRKLGEIAAQAESVRARNFDPMEPLRRKLVARHDSLREMFDRLDRDGSGAVDEDELARALTALGVTQATAALILEAVDTDADGRVSFSEFVRAMQPRAYVQTGALPGTGPRGGFLPRRVGTKRVSSTTDMMRSTEGLVTFDPFAAVNETAVRTEMFGKVAGLGQGAEGHRARRDVIQFREGGLTTEAGQSEGFACYTMQPAKRMVETKSSQIAPVGGTMSTREDPVPPRGRLAAPDAQASRHNLQFSEGHFRANEAAARTDSHQGVFPGPSFGPRFAGRKNRSHVVNGGVAADAPRAKPRGVMQSDPGLPTRSNVNFADTEDPATAAAFTRRAEEEMARRQRKHALTLDKGRSCVSCLFGGLPASSQDTERMEREARKRQTGLASVAGASDARASQLFQADVDPRGPRVGSSIRAQAGGVGARTDWRVERALRINDDGTTPLPAITPGQVGSMQTYRRAVSGPPSSGPPSSGYPPRAATGANFVRSMPQAVPRATQPGYMLRAGSHLMAMRQSGAGGTPHELGSLIGGDTAAGRGAGVRRGHRNMR
jgi:hypothetical protein